jgi:hypothetical protein
LNLLDLWLLIRCLRGEGQLEEDALVTTDQHYVPIMNRYAVGSEFIWELGGSTLLLVMFLVKDQNIPVREDIHESFHVFKVHHCNRWRIS